jgi:WD repeat and SOF domain-containing protein 1
VFTSIDHHQKEGVFVTCGQQVDIWDEQRSSPIRSFSWGVDSFSCVRFNPVEVINPLSVWIVA